MKIFDTLDENQKKTIFTSDETALGIFTYFPNKIIKPDDYYKMSREYYLSHSGEKETSPFYDKILANISELYKAQEFASSIIYAKFGKKWESIYSLFNRSYDVLEEFKRSERESFQGKDSISTSETTDKTGSKQMVGTDTTTTTKNNTIDTTKDTNNTTNTTKNDNIVTTKNTTNTTIAEEATSTDKTVTTTSDDNNNVYGFNSVTAVGSDESNSTNTERTMGEAENNKTTTSETLNGRESGNETEALTSEETLVGSEKYKETEALTGEEKFTKHDTDTITENEERSGNNVADKNHTLLKETSGHNIPVVDMFDKEISFRDRQVFYDIVYKDIDSVIALEIY